MNEAEIRAEHIDPVLLAAGCGVVNGSRVRREYQIAPGRLEGFRRRGKVLKAQYFRSFNRSEFFKNILIVLC